MYNVPVVSTLTYCTLSRSKGLHLHGEKQKLIEKMKITEHKIDIKRKQLQLNF